MSKIKTHLLFAGSVLLVIAAAKFAKNALPVPSAVRDLLP